MAIVTGREPGWMALHFAFGSYTFRAKHPRHAPALVPLGRRSRAAGTGINRMGTSS
jgi:hypothetical protein